MPRRSIEARLTAAFLPEKQPLPPPKGLQPARARAIWAEITLSKPPDFFLTMDATLLTRLCVLSARAEGIEQLLARTPVESEEASRLERRLVAISAALTSLASKLRLTVASRVERHAAVRSSQARSSPPPWHSDLIGGRATRPSQQ